MLRSPYLFVLMLVLALPAQAGEEPAAEPQQLAVYEQDCDHEQHGSGRICRAVNLFRKLPPTPKKALGDLFVVKTPPEEPVYKQSAPIYAPKEYVIRRDVGGVIGEYLLRYKALERVHIIVDGHCNSACTLVLGNIDVCATERGYFNFHAAKKLDGSFSPAGTAHIMERYPPKVRVWIADNGGLTEKWIGTKATTFLPLCKEQPI